MRSQRDSDSDTRSSGRDADRQHAASTAESDPVGSLHRQIGNQAVRALDEQQRSGADTGEAGTESAAGSGSLESPLPGSTNATRRTGVARSRSSLTGTRAASDSPSVSSAVREAIREERREGAYDVSPETGEAIQRASGTGNTLPGPVRTEMEGYLGTTVPDVTVHTDTRADRLSRRTDARAFASGGDIFFRRGEYAPDTGQGRALLAHELAHVASGASSGSHSRVHRFEWPEALSIGSETTQNVDDYVEEVNNHVDAATKPFEEMLTTLQIMRTQFDGDSEEYAQLTQMINGMSEGYSGIQNLKDELGKLSDATSLVSHVASLADAVADLSNLSPGSIRDNPEQAANVFENLAEAAGALGSEYLPGPLAAYADFVQELGGSDFFSNFVDLRRRVEEEYGTFGAQSDVEALDQWFENRDMPQEEQEEEGAQFLSDQAKESLANAAEERAEDALFDDDVGGALPHIGIYVDATLGNDPRSAIRDVAETMGEKIQDVATAWEEYQNISTVRAPGDAHETAIAEVKRAVDELVAYAESYVEERGEVMAMDFEFAMLDQYGLLTRLQETVDEEYADVQGLF